MSDWFDDAMDLLVDLIGPVLAFLAIVAVLVGFIVGVRTWQHTMDTSFCRQFPAATGRETKFVDYTFWTWDCLTRTADGRWIPTGALRDETDS